jgi:hypothetical protein
MQEKSWRWWGRIAFGCRTPPRRKPIIAAEIYIWPQSGAQFNAAAMMTRKKMISNWSRSVGVYCSKREIIDNQLFLKSLRWFGIPQVSKVWIENLNSTNGLDCQWHWNTVPVRFSPSWVTARILVAMDCPNSLPGDPAQVPGFMQKSGTWLRELQELIRANKRGGARGANRRCKRWSKSWNGCKRWDYERVTCRPCIEFYFIYNNKWME